MAKSLAKDLTQGSPTRLIVSFALSLLVSSMMSYVYSTTDSLMVSHYVDPSALGAISAAAPAITLVDGFISSTVSGFSLLAGKIFGAKDEARLKNVMVHVVLLTAILVGASTVLCAVFCRPLVELMQTPASFVDMATSYFFILTVTKPISAIGWVCGAMFRALGDSKTSIVIGAVSGISNVFFNAIFLGVFGMGIEGAAYGTACAVVLSSVMYLILLRLRMRVLIFGRADLYPDRRTVKTLLSNGLPLGLLSSVISLGATILQVAVNGHGEDAVTGVALGGKVLSVLWMVFLNFESAIIYFCAQNLGAKRVDRIRRGIRNTLLISFGVGALLTFVGIFFGKYIYMLFVGGDYPHIIEYAEQYFFTQAIFFPVMVTLSIWRGGLKGLGSTVPAVLCGVIELIVRTVVSVFFSDNLTVLFLAGGPLAWVLVSIFLAILYPKMLRSTERRVAAERIDYYDSREEKQSVAAE